jgi:hypothetical protein
MTGTVTGVIGSSAVRGRTAVCDVPEFFDDFGALYRCAPGVGGRGRDCLIDSASSPRSMPRVANGSSILSLGTTDSSRSRLLTKRSRR